MMDVSLLQIAHSQCHVGLATLEPTMDDFEEFHDDYAFLTTVAGFSPELIAVCGPALGTGLFALASHFPDARFVAVDAVYSLHPAIRDLLGSQLMREYTGLLHHFLETPRTPNLDAIILENVPTHGIDPSTLVSVCRKLSPGGFLVAYELETRINPIVEAAMLELGFVLVHGGMKGLPACFDISYDLKPSEKFNIWQYLPRE